MTLSTATDFRSSTPTSSTLTGAERRADVADARVGQSLLSRSAGWSVIMAFAALAFAASIGAERGGEQAQRSRTVRFLSRVLRIELPAAETATTLRRERAADTATAETSTAALPEHRALYDLVSRATSAAWRPQWARGPPRAASASV